MLPRSAAEREVGSQRRELRAAAHRAGADAPAGRELVERRAHERVARVAPFGNRREHEAVAVLDGQILGRVHRDVGAAVEHGLLHFLR